MSSDAGLASWVRLTATPGVGSTALRKLLQHFGLPSQVLARRRSELAQFLPGDSLSALDSPEVDMAVRRALDWVAEPGNQIITLADGSYPKALLEISDPPALLYCRGQVALLGRPSIAMVGSRNGTVSGIRNAETFATALSQAGYTIVSGLALGIDAAAHRGGLTGVGSTIAVLGTGIDICYPSGNIVLAREIGKRGLLLTQFPLGTQASPSNFPRRNRLISGLSQGCVVVEAALASGSLITARSALEQGREVFAIPGSIHSPLSKGCHALIKSGAKLVETAEDILGEFPSGSRLMRLESSEPSERDRRVTEPLLDHMGFDPIDIDTLCQRAGLPVEDVSGRLLQLELEGLIAKMPGGLVQRLK